MSRSTQEPSVGTADRKDSPSQRFVADYCESRLAVGGLLVFLAILLVAVFAPQISPQDPYDLVALEILDSREPPGTQSVSGHLTYWLGTNAQGRDMLSAIFYGLRTSLLVGAMSGFIALCLGTCIGLMAGYFSGRVDTVIMRIVDLQLSFPAILVALMVLAVPRNLACLTNVAIAIVRCSGRFRYLPEANRHYAARAQDALDAILIAPTA